MKISLRTLRRLIREELEAFDEGRIDDLRAKLNQNKQGGGALRDPNVVPTADDLRGQVHARARERFRAQRPRGSNDSAPGTAPPEQFDRPSRRSVRQQQGHAGHADVRAQQAQDRRRAASAERRQQFVDPAHAQRDRSDTEVPVRRDMGRDEFRAASRDLRTRSTATGPAGPNSSFARKSSETQTPGKFSFKRARGNPQRKPVTRPDLVGDLG